MTKKQTFVDKCYKNERGDIAVFQKPNLPLIVWFISALSARIFSSGSLHNLFAVVSFSASFTWAWMELFSGSNYLRRLLGLVMLTVLIYNRI